MDTTDQDHSFIPPSRVKFVSITIVVWGVLTCLLFKYVPMYVAVFQGFEEQPNSISLIYIYASRVAFGRKRSAFSVARFLLAGIGTQVLFIESFVTLRVRMTRGHQQLRVAIWLLILMPLWVAVIGIIAIGLDIFHLTKTLQ